MEKSNAIGTIRWEIDVKMESIKEEKQLNLNSYATKKTISQGLINVTLLSSNARTLNFVLQIGRIHRFYSFLLWAIYASIFIQLLQMLLCTLLGRLNITKRGNQTCASALNDCILYTNGILILINGFISAFELKDEYSSRAYRSDMLLSDGEFSWNETTTVVPIAYLPG